MESFLETTANYILEHYSDSTAETAIVFPNRRAGLFLRDHLRQKIEKPIWVPRIFGIEAFFEEVSGIKMVGNTELLFEFYHVYRLIEGDKAQDFGDFMQWGQVLLHDFNELDQQLVDTAEFFNYLHEVRKIETWNTDGSPLTILQQNYVEFWKKAGEYYEALKLRLEEQGKGYNGLAARKSSEHIQSYVGKSNGFRKFIFAGFNALTHAEETIMKYLYEEGLADLLWDADKYYIDDKAQEAGLFLRNYQRNWKLKEFKWISDIMLTQPKKIEITGVAQNIGQAKLAGDLINEALREGKLEQTAVVLADENLLQPMLQSIPENCTEVNVTMGNALVNASIAGLLEAAIQMFAGKGDKGFYHADLERFIRQKYFSYLLNEEENIALSAFLEQIHRENLVNILPGDFPENLRKNAIIAAMEEINNGKSLLLWLKKVILRIKDHFLKEQRDSYKMELEYLLSFYQLINRLIELTEEYPFIDSYRTLKTLFKNALNTEKLDFKGEPLSGLQIMGMLETRNLDFRTVILLSANEGTLPAGKTHNTFIPYDVKKKYHLPSFREKDAMFAYHFYRLLQKADHVHLIYNTETDEFGSGEKSRFITQMQDELRSFPNITWKEQIAITPVKTGTYQEVIIKKSPLILKKLAALFEHGISPTAISTYINCPLDFYYRYILGLKEEETVEEVIEADTLGSVMHEVLEKLYQPFENRQVEEKDITAMLDQVRDLTEAAFRQGYSPESLKEGKNFLAKEVTVNYLTTFLKNERDELAASKAPLIIRGTERKLERKINLTNTPFVSVVKLIGKIDRIDEVNGATRIIDYKTGNCEPSELSITDPATLFTSREAGKALQVLTYAYLYAKDQPGTLLKSGILSFRKMSEGLMLLNISKNETISTEMLKDFEKGLIQHLEAMLDEQIPFKHDPGSVWCRFCGN